MLSGERVGVVTQLYLSRGSGPAANRLVRDNKLFYRFDCFEIQSSARLTNEEATVYRKVSSSKAEEHWFIFCAALWTRAPSLKKCFPAPFEKVLKWLAFTSLNKCNTWCSGPGRERCPSPPGARRNIYKPSSPLWNWHSTRHEAVLQRWGVECHPIFNSDS